MAVPKLRFGCTDWKKVELKDIAKRVTRKNKKNETDLPLTISSLDGLVDQREYFKKQVASKDMSGYYLIYNGEFAYNKSYSVGFDFGSVKRLDKYSNGALSTLYICFALEDIVNSDFIVGYFDSCKWNRYISKVCAEGARNHGLLNISADDFMKMRICLPDLEEQKKIADFLTAFDKRIAAQQNIIADLEETKKGVLQKIFSQEIRFKDENGQDYPEWEKSKLLDLCDVRDGTHDTPKYVDDGYPLVTSKNLLDNGTIDLSNALKISKVDYDKINERSKVDIGDIIFGMIGTIGKPVITAFDGFAIKNVALLKKKNRQINFQYLYQYFFSTAIKKQFIINAAGGTQQFIALGTIRSLEIMCPIKAEQQKIADFLSTFDKKITAEKQILSDLQEMKKGLLQQMFV